MMAEDLIPSSSYLITFPTASLNSASKYGYATWARRASWPSPCLCADSTTGRRGLLRDGKLVGHGEA
jgi:hypothetical protein